MVEVQETGFEIECRHDMAEQDSCKDCLETPVTEVSIKPSHTPLKEADVNDTNVRHCCCRCHDEDGNNTLSNTDSITNLQINCDENSNQTSASSPNKSTTSDRICRICLDNVDQGQLIAPCKCSGSTKYAHEHCLLQWFFKSSKKSCEVCLGQVNVTPIGYKPVQQWRLPDRGCDFIVYLFGLYFLIMVIFTGMITWIATQGCTSPVCVTLYAVCGIALLYFFYCCGCVEYSRRYWRALLSVNRVWRIYGREDSLKNFKFTLTPKPKKRDMIVTVQTEEALHTSRENSSRGNRDNPSSRSVVDTSHSNNRETGSNINSNTQEIYVIGLDNHAVDMEEGW